MNTSAAVTPERDMLRIGPLVFQPGVTRGNVVTVMYGAFITIALMSYIGFIQPFVLTDILQVPAGRQGAVTGNMVLMHEIIVLMFMGLAGAASDRVGRRMVFMTGFLVVALGFVLYPLAGSVPELYGARAVYALGAAIAPIMVTATMVDLVSERSRGRWVGCISIMSALGAVFMALVLSRLPQAFMDRGVSAAYAGRYALWIAAALSLLTVGILWAGIRGGILSGAGPLAREKRSAITDMLIGARVAAANPRLGLALAGGFIGRGDFAVIGSFFSLWIIQAGKAQGMETGEALAYAGRIFGVVQLSAMAWGACMGYISDRMDRVGALAVGAVLSALGYTVLSWTEDPFSGGMLGVAVLAGIGEVSVVVAAGSLLGQQAPADRRGTLSGLYGVLGALGIAVVGFVGGQLFDRVAWQGPFLLMVGLNLLLALAAVLVRFGTRTRLLAGAPGR